MTSLKDDFRLAEDIGLLKQYKEALKNYCKTCVTCWGKDCDWYFDCPRIKKEVNKT